MNRLTCLQIEIYTAVGGGLVGRMYAQQPQEAYLDDRAGKRPYKRKEIEQMRQRLVKTATELGYDPANLPELPVW